MGSSLRHLPIYAPLGMLLFGCGPSLGQSAPSGSPSFQGGCCLAVTGSNWLSRKPPPSSALQWRSRETQVIQPALHTKPIRTVATASAVCRA